MEVRGRKKKSIKYETTVGNGMRLTIQWNPAENDRMEKNAKNRLKEL